MLFPFKERERPYNRELLTQERMFREKLRRHNLQEAPSPASQNSSLVQVSSLQDKGKALRLVTTGSVNMPSSVNAFTDASVLWQRCTDIHGKEQFCIISVSGKQTCEDSHH